MRGAEDPHRDKSRDVWIDPVELRRREYALLLYLAREPTRVFAKAELLRRVWGYPSQDTSRTVDTHASRLRSKLAEAGADRLGAFDVGCRLLPHAENLR